MEQMISNETPFFPFEIWFLGILGALRETIEAR
jgi:hypothetical protein